MKIINQGNIVRKNLRDNFVKGYYADTPYNRKLARVGQQYDIPKEEIEKKKQEITAEKVKKPLKMGDFQTKNLNIKQVFVSLNKIMFEGHYVSKKGEYIREKDYIDITLDLDFDRKSAFINSFEIKKEDRIAGLELLETVITKMRLKGFHRFAAYVSEETPYIALMMKKIGASSGYKTKDGEYWILNKE